MSEIVKLDSFNIDINDEMTLKMINCFSDNPDYDGLYKDYMTIKEEVISVIKPSAIFAFDKINENEAFTCALKVNTEVLYLVTTIGNEAGELIDKYFKEDKHLSGVMADAIAEMCLISMENDIAVGIMQECKVRGLGIKRRYEAPDDIPMIFQKIAVDKTKASERLGVRVNSGYIIEPVKSMVQVFVVSDNMNDAEVKHDCNSCAKSNCKMRKPDDIKLTVVSDYNDEMYEDSKITICQDYD